MVSDVQVFASTSKSKQTVLTHDNESGHNIWQNVPAHIALGHELIHGYRSMQCEANDDIDVEEKTTTGIDGFEYKFTENKLSKEQKINKRIRH